MIRTLPALVAALLFAGCASTYPSLAELKPTPTDRAPAGSAPADSAAITLLRSKEFLGSGVNYRVLVNGELLASIGWAEWMTIQAAPGDVILEVRHPLPVLGVSGDSAAFNAAPNGRYYFRVMSSADGPRLVRTTEASASGH